MAQRSTKAVQRWNASKKIELQRMRKQKVEEVRKAEEESKEIETKRQASKIAADKWIEEKTQELTCQQRGKKKKEQEEAKKKKEEAVEKVQYASQVFEAW